MALDTVQIFHNKRSILRKLRERMQALKDSPEIQWEALAEDIKKNLITANDAEAWIQGLIEFKKKYPLFKKIIEDEETRATESLENAVLAPYLEPENIDRLHWAESFDIKGNWIQSIQTLPEEDQARIFDLICDAQIDAPSRPQQTVNI